jgi:hypothetical protein
MFQVKNCKGCSYKEVTLIWFMLLCIIYLNILGKVTLNFKLVGLWVVNRNRDLTNVKS